jgi:hypothetical protein
MAQVRQQLLQQKGLVESKRRGHFHVVEASLEASLAAVAAAAALAAVTAAAVTAAAVTAAAVTAEVTPVSSNRP